MAPRNNTGIFNSRSEINEYVRDLRTAPLPGVVRVCLNVTRVDLETLEIHVQSRLNLAAFYESAVLVREFKKQLSILAQAKAELEGAA